MKLYIGFVYLFDGTKDWHIFASNGMRKDMKEEFRDVYNYNYGSKIGRADVTMEDIDEVFTLSEVYDVLGAKNYKIILRAK